MSEKDIARIDTTMKHLVELTKEQNTTLHKMLETLTDTRTTLATVCVQLDSHSERIGKLESDKTWIVRLILAAFIAATIIAIKVTQ
jgi:predicted  nucleic acid-binding Zn-ribbon protein